MASQTRSPGTVVSGTGSPAWSNPGNAAASDDAHASCIVDMTETSANLDGDDFSFSIPVGSAIDGVEVHIEGYGDMPDEVAISSVQILSAWGAAQKLPSQNLGGSDQVFDVGGPADKWGLNAGGGLLAENFNASTFLVRVNVANVVGWPSAGRIDHVSVTVHYTEPVYTATAALAIGAATLSADVDVTNPSYSGAAALSIAPATLSSPATFTTDRTAGVALTLGAMTITSAAAYTAPVLTSPVTASPTSASTAANPDVGFSIPWDNPGNVVSSNNVYATVSMFTAETSDLLIAEGFDFSALDDALVIDGLEVLLEIKQSDVDEIRIERVQLQKAGVGQDILGQFTEIPTTEDVLTYGSPTELHGTTWTGADLKHADFAAVLAVVSWGGFGGTVSADHLRVRAYFATPSYTAAAALSVAAATLAAEASYVDNLAAAALVLPAPALAAAATFDAPVYEATADLTLPAATLAATGTYADYVAEAALTMAAATLAADATFAPGTKTATAELTIAAMTLSAVATFTETREAAVHHVTFLALLRVREELADVAASDPFITAGGFSRSQRLGPNTSPPVERASYSRPTLDAGGQATLDLTDLPGTQDNIDGSGRRVQILLVRNRNHTLTIDAGGSDGYDLFGGPVELPPRCVMLIFAPDQLPLVAAGAKHIQLDGTAGDRPRIGILLG